MTISRADITLNNNTDAIFRAWGLAVSTALQAVGLIKTMDTGQINFSTVLTTSAGNQTRGYEIYRLADALQSTAPVFIKVEYGSGGSGVTQSAMWVTVGTGTDGAGTLTGLVSTRYQVNLSIPGNGSPGVAPSPVFVSGDLSSVGVVFTGISSAGQPFAFWGLFLIERTRNADGTPNSDGLTLSINSTGSSNVCNTQMLSFTNTALSASMAFLTCPMSARYTTFNTGSEIVVFPTVVATPKVQAPNQLFLGSGSTDFVRGALVQVLVNGAQRTYIACPNIAGLRGSISANPISLLLRWE